MTQADAVFSALADPTRRSIFEHVAAHGSITASAIAAEVPVSRQAVSKHLASLGDAGLVTKERVGREVQYSATPGPLTDVMAWVADVGSVWDARLERLREMF